LLYWTCLSIGIDLSRKRQKNAFAFYTQIAKNAYAKGWNKLHPGKYKGTLSLDGGLENQGGIYSI